MGVCGSAGAGLCASGNVPSMNFCSESLSAAAAATPCIFPDRERRNKVRHYKKEEEEQQRRSCGAESCDLTSWMKLLFC